MCFLWLSVVVAATILEAVTSQLVSIWFVVGGICALITSLYSVSLAVQLVVFASASVIALILARPILKNALKFKTEDVNLGRFIGKNAKVIEDIDNDLEKGQVRLCGNTWTARSSNGDVIPEGETVIVESIEGVKVVVHRI